MLKIITPIYIITMFETRKVSYLNFNKHYQSELKNSALNPTEKENLQRKSRAGQTILIDFGSETMKAGYSSSNLPTIIMKSNAAKFASQTFNKTNPLQVGYSEEEMDTTKNSYINIYEKNIIDHHSKFELCCDHIFMNLGCTQQTIQNPLIITQTLANPQYIRQQEIQLFFQCYNVDQLFIGIDALFAYFYQIQGNIEKYQTESRLIISCGAAVTHVIPIVKGKVDYSNIRRINIGANNSFETFCKLITLKNPSVKKYFTNVFMRHLYNEFCEVSLDYHKQLEYFKNQGVVEKTTSYKNRIQEENKHIQQVENLLNPVEVVIEQPQLQLSLQYQQRREEVKKMMSERLRQALERKKNEKIRLHREQYDELIDLKKRWQEDPDNVNDELVELLGNSNPHIALKKRIRILEGKLNLAPSQPQEKKNSLLDVPDSELDIKGLRMKRLQEYRKKAAEERDYKKKQQQQQDNRLKLLREQNPQLYLDKLKTRYNQLSVRMKQNQKQKQDFSSRNSELSRQKIRNIISLQDGDLEDENFGQNDDDWKLYQINEESDHQSELDAIEQQLRDVDPSWMQSSDKHHLNTGNTLYLSTQLIKGPQIYFQPLIIGNDQVNLPDAVYSSLKGYSKQIQEELLRSVLLVGGGSLLKGLKERLQKQLISNFETGILVNVQTTKQPLIGAYLGMTLLSIKYPHYVKQNSLTKIQYESRKIKSQEHLFNNILWD